MPPSDAKHYHESVKVWGAGGRRRFTPVSCARHASFRALLLPQPRRICCTETHEKLTFGRRISRYDTCRVTTDYVQSREYHDHNVHPREPRKSLATGSNIFALLTKRRKGICAVALLIGASGAGVGVAAAVGAASASGQAGGWRAATGAQGGAWHSHAAQGSGGWQGAPARPRMRRSPRPPPPARTDPTPAPAGTVTGVERQRQRLGQRRRSGVPGRASSRDDHDFGDPHASTSASGRWEQRPRHYGPSGHRLAPRRSTAVHHDHLPSGRRDTAAWRRSVERRQPGQAARRGEAGRTAPAIDLRRAPRARSRTRSSRQVRWGWS